MIDCVLIVVAYRSTAALGRLLESVPDAVDGLSWHVVVVNNDPTADLADVVGAHAHAQLVESGANIGYAGGLNRGLQMAPPARWTAFLNPDLELRPGSIARLTATAGVQDAAVPTIVDDDGVRQWSLRREPTVVAALGDGLFGDRWPRRPSVLSETIRDPVAYGRPGSVDWATGAVLVVATRVAVEVGPWDAERFFLYSEETDYCRRLRARGSAIRFVPEAVVQHRGAGSGTSDALHALQEVNRVRYFRKWHGDAESALFTGVIVLKHLLRIHRREARASVRALVSPGSRTALPGGGR